MKSTYVTKPLNVIEMENNVLQIRSLGRIFLLRFEDEHCIGEFRKILSLMDGTRDLEEISRGIDLPRDDYDMIINQIREYDLLEPVTPDALQGVPADYRQAHEKVFRVFDLSSYAKSKSECIHTLFQSDITVVGDNPLSREIFHRLLAFGFRKLSLIRLGTGGQTRAGLKKEKTAYPHVELHESHVSDMGDIDPVVLGDFTIAPLVGGNEEYYEALNQLCVKHGKNWIPVFTEPTKAYIGPAVIPHKTACYRCLQLRLLSDMENLEAYKAYREYKKEHTPEVFALRTNLETTANFFIVEFYKLVTQYRYAATYNHIIEISFFDNGISVPAVLKFPRCPVCANKAKKVPFDNYAYHTFLDKMKNGTAVKGVH